MEIAAALVADPDIDSAEVAGPGFINIKLRPSVFETVLATALSQAEQFGIAQRSREAAPVNIEYVSANPTGPLHVCLLYTSPSPRDS